MYQKDKTDEDRKEVCRVVAVVRFRAAFPVATLNFSADTSCLDDRAVPKYLSRSYAPKSERIGKLLIPKRKHYYQGNVCRIPEEA